MKKIFRIGVNTFIENDSNQFLFVKRNGNHVYGNNQWQLVGGKLQFGESPEQAIRREILEETKCKLVDTKILGFRTYLIKEKENDVSELWVYFKSKINGTIQLSEEHTEFKWLELNKALKEELSDGIRKFIEEEMI